jgi:hypothetical protein
MACCQHLSSDLQVTMSTTCQATTFSHLPLHLQSQLCALAGAPLSTCKAAAHLAGDPQLVAQWLRLARRWPLLTAAKHGLWDICQLLLKCEGPINDCVAAAVIRLAAKARQVQLVTDLMPSVLSGAPNSANRSICLGALSEAVHSAMENGDVHMCSRILQQLSPPDKAAVVTKLHRLTLQLENAAQKGDAVMVCFCLEVYRGSPQPALNAALVAAATRGPNPNPNPGAGAA